MCIPDPTFYALLADVLREMVGPLHPASLASLVDLVSALLFAQSLHFADLLRALPNLQTACARQGYRRIHRILARPLLRSVPLTPVLIRAALRLVGAGEVTLVLDSTRCLRWEIFTVGLRLHGRVVPIAWDVLPFPWPKKHFTPTVLRLLQRVRASWPADRPAHLVADRGFPSLPFFRLLAEWGAQQPVGYTIRLRASDWVHRADGTSLKVGEREATLGPGEWCCDEAAYRQGKQQGPIAHLVIGRGIAVLPPHQMGPADRQRRGKRAQRRIAQRRSMGQPSAERTDRVWALLSTRPTWVAAVRSYRERPTTEGTYRDLKAWGLATVAGHLRQQALVEGLVGLSALTYVFEVSVGVAAGRTADPAARARQRQWSTTGRLSLSWRARHLLHDHASDWRPWLHATLPSLFLPSSPAARSPRSLGPPTDHPEAA